MASNEMSQSALAGGISKAVRPLLDLVDELRALGIEQELALPQVAVMGDLDKEHERNKKSTYLPSGPLFHFG